MFLYIALLSLFLCKSSYSMDMQLLPVSTALTAESYTLESLPPEVIVYICGKLALAHPTAYDAAHQLHVLCRVNKKFNALTKPLLSSMKTITPSSTSTQEAPYPSPFLQMLSTKFSAHEIAAALTSLSTITAQQEALKDKPEHLLQFNKNHLAWSAYFGNAPITEYLMSRVPGHEQDNTYRNGDALKLPPIMLAIEQKHPHIVQLLIQGGTPSFVSYSLTEGQVITLTRNATDRSHFNAWQQWQRNNADPATEPTFPLTIMNFAQMQGNQKIINLIKQYVAARNQANALFE